VRSSPTRFDRFGEHHPTCLFTIQMFLTSDEEVTFWADEENRPLRHLLGYRPRVPRRGVPSLDRMISQNRRNQSELPPQFSIETKVRPASDSGA
jgi:hypothetical protein